MAATQKPKKLSLRTTEDTHNPKERLQSFGASKFTRDCNAIIVVVPGIGTDPVKSWKSGSILYSLQKISNELTSNNAYVCWWDHGLPLSHLLSFHHQHTSAVDLLLAVRELLAILPNELCPIIFVGHSIGGLIIKEALRSWDQSVHRNECILCTAGVIFLATPHTMQPSRALVFCKMASLAFLKERTFDSKYAPEMASLCKMFEAMNLPTFSIFEGARTKLGAWKNDLLVDRELALFGTEDEQLWSVKCTHKDLCHCAGTEDMYEALAQFLEKTIRDRIDKINLKRPRKSSYSIKTRPTLKSIKSFEEPYFTESPINRLSTQPTSPSSSAPDAEVAGSDTAAIRPSPARTTGVFHNIPKENDLYFPRDDVLQPVEDVLLQADPWQDLTTFTDRIRAFALSGSGGMGKSVSAGHFLHKHKYRYENIFWVNAERISKLFDAYSQIALKLHLVNPMMPHDRFDCQRRVTNWLMWSALESRQDRVKWLLVFDNVERLEDLNGFWPSRGCGDILVTTQCSIAELNKFSGLYGTEVRPFGKDLALAFLSRLTPENIRDPVQLAQATQIAETLGGSPLALMALSSLIKQGRLDQDLIKRVTHQSKRRESSGSSHSRPDLSGESLNQLTAIVEPTLEKLTISVSLIDVMSLLDPDGAQEPILKDAIKCMHLTSFPGSVAAYNAAKNELLKSALAVNVQIGDEDGIAIHRMIREIVRRRMSGARLREVFENTVYMLWDLWPEMGLADRHNKRRFGKIDVLLRHVRSMQEVYELPGATELELPFRANITFGRLLNNAAWCMYERGDYEDGKYFAEQARSIGEELEEDDASVGRFDVPDLLSNVYYTLGAIAQITHHKGESLDLHAKMLVLRKNLKSELRDGDALLAHAYNEIGNDFMTDDEYDIAVGFYTTSIKIYQSLGKDFKPSMLILPKVNLGLAYWLQKDHRKAFDLVHEALQQQERDPNYGLTMKTGRLLFAMGNITYSLGEYDESLDYHERAYEQFKTTIGSRHNRTCDVMWRLADHHERRTDYDKAIQMLNDALDNVWNRPLFEREKARLCYKKYKVMRCTKEYSQPSQYQQYLDTASQIYCKHRPSKPQDQLEENDFNDLVMFWSR